MMTWCLSCILGTSIGYTGMLVQSKLSATTHLLMTNVNKVIVALIGIIWFEETASLLSYVSIGCSLLGVLVYNGDSLC